jgi:hypothetical protein
MPFSDANLFRDEKIYILDGGGSRSHPYDQDAFRGGASDSRRREARRSQAAHAHLLLFRRMTAVCENSGHRE